MTGHVAAGARSLVMLGGRVVTEWVPLCPPNDSEPPTPGERLRPVAGYFTVLLAIAVGFATSTRLGAILAEVLAVSWLIAHGVAWWRPDLGHSVERHHEADRSEYSRTLKLVLAEGRDVVVDGQPMVVGVLTPPMGRVRDLAGCGRAVTRPA